MSTEAITKVRESHLRRGAYLYIRQSTLHQVLNNTESGIRQYDLAKRALALGWKHDQVIVVDVDQGHSGASAADREGFQRLVSDVSMGRAGIVLGLECSRLARNNADWHRLLEICALSDTLICDEDGLYDPSEFNDRMLLGLKGTLSEAELHFIRARLRGGQLSKARRGELVMALPVGLVYDPTGKVVLDPDAGVQRALNYLFATFAHLGSARAVVQVFRTEGLKFPARIRFGAHKGELSWTPLSHDRVLRILHNPRYAGAFVYGRHRQRLNANGRLRTEMLPRELWTALIPGAHGGYISWETYELNQQLLAANAQARGPERSAGPAREGNALLQGLAVCGRCGCHMSVAYHLRLGVEVPEYRCMRAFISDGAKACSRIPGAGIDAAIGELLLGMVSPLTLEVALSVEAELEARADEADALRRTHLERARHLVESARRRYLAVDPDNRLVASALEADWNDALRQLYSAEDDYAKVTSVAQTVLSEENKARIRSLASDFPALLSNPATPQRERKRMARLLIEDVTITRSDRIELHVRFKGGQTTSLSIPLPLIGYEIHQTDAKTIAELDRLLVTHTDAEAAKALNSAGHHTGTGLAFTPTIVRDLRRSNGLASHLKRLRAQGLISATELAEQIGVHPLTVKTWQRLGIISSYKANDRNMQLFDPPMPGDPRYSKKQGSPLEKRLPT